MVKGMRLLTVPTATIRPHYGQGGRWRLISHLALNHLSLVSDGGVEALKEILLLYDFRNSAETRALIDGITALSSQSGTARVRSFGQSAFCRGVDVTMTFEEGNFSGDATRRPRSPARPDHRQGARPLFRLGTFQRRRVIAR